jgi:membrane protein YdbS with pleckstrin-like domain
MNPVDVNLRQADSAGALAAATPSASTPLETDLPAAVPSGTDQETDVWWGSWSGWTMLPSMAISIVLTGVIVWWAWTHVDRRFVQLTIWALAGLVWLVQLARWSWHWFGHNYRLTTRRLIVWRGHLRRFHLMAPLSQLEHVRVEEYVHSRWTKVGRIVVAVHASGEPHRDEVELNGVRNPHEVVELIRAMSLRARAWPSQAPK